MKAALRAAERELMLHGNLWKKAGYTSEARRAFRAAREAREALGLEGGYAAVPSCLLLDAMTRSEVTARELAVRMGWLDRGRPDSGRVRRVLGHGSAPQATTSVAIAGELLRHMGHWPGDFGL